MSFDTLNLSPTLIKTLRQLHYTKPTAIQKKAIPVILSGKDILAAAQTGTGKTAAFALPLLQRISENNHSQHKSVKALVLAPTRELAYQIAKNLNNYGQKLKTKTMAVFGGVKIGSQIKELRHGVDILVATPGRLLDLYKQRVINFKECEYVVLDEADRMLDMGFIEDIRRILKLLPKKRQTMLFSATFSKSIKSLANDFLFRPTELAITPEHKSVERIHQVVHPVMQKQKAELLSYLIHKEKWQQALVFTKTRRAAKKLEVYLDKQGITTDSIHGEKTQKARLKALNSFKSGKTRILVATDIAARGIDIHQLPQVVNYDLPQSAEDYVHRIGRTGRAGSSGVASSFVANDEFSRLCAIERLIKRVLPREEIEGFEPNQSLPASNTKPLKPKSKHVKRSRFNNKTGPKNRTKHRTKHTSRRSTSKKRRAIA